MQFFYAIKFSKFVLAKQENLEFQNSQFILFFFA